MKPAAVGSLGLCITYASVAFAHEGHGDPRWTNTLFHYLIEPQHAWVVLGGMAAVLWMVVVRQRRRRDGRAGRRANSAE